MASLHLPCLLGRHPNFVTLHPQQGIVVLEVKDWRLDTIVNANSKQVERGSVSTDNPFMIRQARRKRIKSVLP